MKVVTSKIPRKYRGPEGVRVVIPLIKESKDANEDDTVIQVQLRSDPSNPDSPEYSFPISPFKEGTPEVYLKWKEDLVKVNHGLNNTTGPVKYLFARRLLEGDALTAFEAEAQGKTETNSNYQLCIDAVTAHVLPKKAVKIQSVTFAVMSRSHRT